MRAVGYNETTDKVKISPYLPDFVADGILEVDFELLRSIGIKHLLMDLDQTLRQAYSRKLDTEVVDFFATLAQKKTFQSINIVSNNNRNLSRYAEPLQARIFQPFWHGLHMIRKPNPMFYARVLEELGADPKTTVMIGDKVRLDVAGANRLGIYTVLVKRRGRDYWFDYLFLARWREYRTLAEAIHIKSNDVRSTPDYIRSGLHKLGIKSGVMSKPVRLPSGALLFITYGAKQSVSIKVLNRWRSTTNWIQRLWRYLYPSWNGEAAPYFGAKHILEHEAYIMQQARDGAVHTPAILGVLDLGDYRFGLATKTIDGSTVDMLPLKRVTQQLLGSIWKEVSLLHRAKIAHGDCNLRNIVIDTKGQPWLTNFDFATTAAPLANQLRDNVELLISTAILIGPNHALMAAHTALDKKTFTLTLNELHINNLSWFTRAAMKHHNPNLITDIHQRSQKFI